MAKQTKLENRQLLIYQVFPRNHSEQGDFQGVIDDLPRIKKMGVDVLYLLPIYPIGNLNRKGDMGSPYAITDYYGINEEYGNLDMFKELLSKTHEAGMKVMIDIVINHTAPDHYYTKTNPEYYYRKPNGSFGNKVGDWTDIIDLDYKNQDLWQEMIRMLSYWAQLGVDGFRCDVASFVPLDFWLAARKTIEEINPEMLWLAESVHKEFLQYYRNQGYLAHSDSEVFQAFDICYDYEIHSEWNSLMHGKATLEDYARMLNLQESIYPSNYSKLRFLENHDQPRIHSLTSDAALTQHWTAFSFFQKGTAFLYAGQEKYAVKQPSLFTKDLVNELTQESTKDNSFEELVKRLADIKKRPITIHHTKYIVTPVHENIMQVSYENEEEILIGYFRLKSSGSLEIMVDIPDNTYINELTSKPVIITLGKLIIENPVILSIKKSDL